MLTPLYIITYKAGSEYHRVESVFEKVSSPRKTAKFSEIKAFSEVTVWAGQPGGARA